MFLKSTDVFMVCIMDNHPLVVAMNRRLACMETGERLAREELYAEVCKMVSDPSWYEYDKLILLAYRLRHFRDSVQSMRSDLGGWAESA